MSVWDFEKEFRKIDREYPNRPDWSYPYDNKVYDEDKSVKWNRERRTLKSRPDGRKKKEL